MFLILQKPLFEGHEETKLIVVYLDFHPTKLALSLVDSWSHAPDQIQIYPDWDTIAQLLPARRLCLFVIAI